MVFDGKRRDRPRWISAAATSTALGVFLGFVGPFGSFFNGPTWQRTVYWVALAWASFAIFKLSEGRLRPRLRSGPGRWAVLSGFAIVAAAPMGVVSWFLARAIWPALRQVPELTPAVWYLQSLVITALQVALFAGARSSAAASGEPRAEPDLAGLLGAAPADVLCLQMEDHYVRVHLPGRSRMVLATMTQAVAALGAARGLRVHRSWWVAERAVTEIAQEGRSLRLVLSNGLAVPVARSAVAAVRSAGWLRPRQVSSLEPLEPTPAKREPMEVGAPSS